jgi:uncharacterized protein YraI
MQFINLHAVYKFTWPTVSAAPRVSSITEDGCLVEWSLVKLSSMSGVMHFKVQLTKVKDNETKIVSDFSDYVPM